jgi:hypothetical protein
VKCSRSWDKSHLTSCSLDAGTIVASGLCMLDFRGLALTSLEMHELAASELVKQQNYLFYAFVDVDGLFCRFFPRRRSHVHRSPRLIMPRIPSIIVHSW